MKTIFLLVNTLFLAILALNSDCYANNTQYDSQIETSPIKPAYFIDRSFFSRPTWVKIYTDDGFKVAEGNTGLLSDEKTGLILLDGQDRIVATATLCTLLPKNIDAYFIRDDQNYLIGYLTIHNNGLLSDIFKPLTTTLYSANETPLLHTVYSRCGLSFKMYDMQQDGRLIGMAKSRWSHKLDVELAPSLDINSNLLLSSLQIHACKDVLLNPTRHVHWYGPINFSAQKNLANIALEALMKVQESNSLTDQTTIQPVEEGTHEDKLAWAQLTEELEQTTEPALLEEEQMETIAQQLAEKFENSEGKADPNEILQELGSLANEEKAILIELLKAKGDRF